MLFAGGESRPAGAYSCESRVARGRLRPTRGAPPPPKPAVTVVDLHARPVSLTTELPGRVRRATSRGASRQVNGVGN